MKDFSNECEIVPVDGGFEVNTFIITYRTKEDIFLVFSCLFMIVRVILHGIALKHVDSFTFQLEVP